MEVCLYNYFYLFLVNGSLIPIILCFLDHWTITHTWSDHGTEVSSSLTRLDDLLVGT